MKTAARDVSRNRVPTARRSRAPGLAGRRGSRRRKRTGCGVEAHLAASPERVAVERERRVGEARLGLDRRPRDPVERHLDGRARDPGRVRQLEDDPADRARLRQHDDDPARREARRDGVAPRDDGGGRPRRDLEHAIAPGFGHGREPLERQRPVPAAAGATTWRTPTARRKRTPSSSTPRSNSSIARSNGRGMKPESPFTRGRPWARPSSIASVSFPARGSTRTAPSLPREPPRRRRRAGVALEAQREVRRLDHHQAEGGEHDGPTTAREGEAGEHREREGRDEGEARQRAHAAHEHHVLVQEAVESGVRPEREDDRHRRGGHGHGPIAARRRGQPGDAEGERDEPGEESVAHRRRGPAAAA